SHHHRGNRKELYLVPGVLRRAEPLLYRLREAPQLFSSVPHLHCTEIPAAPHAPLPVPMRSRGRRVAEGGNGWHQLRLSIKYLRVNSQRTLVVRTPYDNSRKS